MTVIVVEDSVDTLNGLVHIRSQERFNDRNKNRADIENDLEVGVDGLFRAKKKAVVIG